MIPSITGCNLQLKLKRDAALVLRTIWWERTKKTRLTNNCAHYKWKRGKGLQRLISSTLFCLHQCHYLSFAICQKFSWVSQKIVIHSFMYIVHCTSCTDILQKLLIYSHPASIGWVTLSLLFVVVRPAAVTFLLLHHFPALPPSPPSPP